MIDISSPRLRPGESWPELRARSEIWLALAAEAFDRHSLKIDPDATLGVGGSYPVALSGDYVVKFFGFAGKWAATWENERLAHERLALDPRILAPRLVGAGELFPGDEQPIPYLILSRILGRDWHEAGSAFDVRVQIATDLGTQLRLIHALPIDGLPTIETWCDRTIADGARRGAFPAHLIDRVDEWVAAIPMGSPAFVHSDLFARHPFIERGQLSGIIDWGDAMAADPHVELGKLHLDVFEGDTRLLSALLDAYGWPVADDFTRRCLAMALRRHTQIHGQHGSGGDMFYRVPELILGNPIESLDQLADVLFGFQ